MSIYNMIFFLFTVGLTNIYSSRIEDLKIKRCFAYNFVPNYRKASLLKRARLKIPKLPFPKRRAFIFLGSESTEIT